MGSYFCRISHVGGSRTLAWESDSADARGRWGGLQLVSAAASESERGCRARRRRICALLTGGGVSRETTTFSRCEMVRCEVRGVRCVVKREV